MKRFLNYVLFIIFVLLFSNVVYATEYIYHFNGTNGECNVEDNCIPAGSYLIGSYLFLSTDPADPVVYNNIDVMAGTATVDDKNFLDLFIKYDENFWMGTYGTSIYGAEIIESPYGAINDVCITHVNGTKLTDAYCPSANPDKMALFKSRNDDGDISQRVFFAEGNPITPPVAGSIKGLEFVCWKKEGSNSCYNFTNPVLDGDVFNAEYEAIQYTITYDLNGGNGSVPTSTVCDAPTNNQPGSFSEPCKFAPIGTAYKLGYQFAGWSFTETDDNDITDGYFNPGDSVFDYLGDETTVTLYAVWKPETYSITFKQDNGLDDVEINYVYSSRGVEVDTFVPKKDGYIFDKWSPYNTPGIEYDNGSVTISVPGNKVLKAGYNPRTVSFVYTGTELSDTVCSYTDTTCTLEDYNPGTGWDFVGWQITDSNNTGVVIKKNQTVDPKVFDKEIINVEAVKEKHIYTANINLNGGYGKNYITQYNIVDSGNLTLGLADNDPVKEGYHFTGWKYANGDPVNVNNINRVADLVIYADYEANSITIKYYNDGAVVHTQTCTYPVSCNVTAENIASTDTQVFNGYRYNGTLYHNGDPINITATSGEVSFIADYTYSDRVYYDIEYDYGIRTGYGYIDGTPVSQIESTATNVSLPSAYSKGYHFDGWKRKLANGNYVDTNGSINGSDAVGGIVYLKASWTPNEFEFVFNGTGFDGYRSVICRYGESCSLGEHTSLIEGQELVGWGLSNDNMLALGDNLDVSNFTDGSDTINLYPVWNVTQYHIYYYANGGTLTGNYDTSYTNETTLVTLPTVTRENARFIKWVDLDGNEVTASDIPQSNHDYVLIAEFATTYTINFEDNGSPVGTPVTCTYGEACTIETPDLNLDEHYSDVVWKTSGGVVLESPMTVTDTTIISRTYIADYSKIKYDVVFKDKDGVVIPNTEMLCTYNSNCSVEEVVAPAVTDMVFADWESDPSGVYSEGNVLVTDNTIDTVTLTAQYVDAYDIYFHDSKSTSVYHVVCGYGVSCNLDEFLENNFPGHNDLDFTGWRDINNEIIYSPNFTFNDTDVDEINFITDWEDEFFIIIKEDVNDSGYVFDTYQYFVNYYISSFPVPTKENYRFTGYVDENGEPAEDFIAISDNEHVFIETWSNEYEVEYLYNAQYGNYGTYQTVTCNYGVACDITVSNPTYPGFMQDLLFSEWEPGDEGVDYENPLTFSDTNYAKITFKAKWVMGAHGN